MEFTEDNQEPRFKEIKTFINKVETFGAQGNSQKIEWH